MRALIAEIEAKHGQHVDFHIGRIWAMTNGEVVERVIENKLHVPKNKPKIEFIRQRAQDRAELCTKLRASGMTWKEVAKAAGISESYAASTVYWHNRKIELSQLMKENHMGEYK